jgi:hypothetical protein
MRFLTLDLMDGSPIEVIVSNEADADRIEKFMSEAIAALEELYEDQDPRSMGWVGGDGRPGLARAAARGGSRRGGGGDGCSVRTA